MTYEFPFNKKFLRWRFISSMVTPWFYLIFVAYLQGAEYLWLKIGLVIIVIFSTIFEIRTFLRHRQQPALTISDSVMESPFFSQPIERSSITKILYRNGYIQSLLIIELADPKQYIRQAPLLSRIMLQYKLWRWGSPAIIILNQVGNIGEKEVFDQIEMALQELKSLVTS